MDKPVVYSVAISLNGKKDTNRVAKVIFQTSEIKERYIRDEYKYCRSEEEAYLIARHKNQRTRTYDALLAKRVEFAKHSGYAPTTDRKIWKFVGNDQYSEPPKHYA